MGSLAYTADGPPEAPVVVLSGSLGSTVEMWEPQMAALTTRWRVVRVDHPGHGASPVWDEPVTVDGIGRAVRDVLAELRCERASFFGLSLGGAVVQWLAAHAPQNVDRLILCSTAAAFPNPDAYLERATVVRARGTDAVAGTVVERWFTPEFRAHQPDVVAGCRAMIESIPDEGYAQCCEAVAAFDGRNDLSHIEAPTLVLAGADDVATPPQHARALSRRIARTQLEVIPDAAHLANIEQPDVVNDAIVRHLSEAGRA